MSQPPAGQLLRLFVACELSNEVREALAQVQSQLRQHLRVRLRWARPEGVHLTLKFLGETPADKVAAIREAVAQACRGISPLRLSLGEVGTFGDRRGPRVIWLGVSGDVERLSELQRRVEDSLAAVGWPREERAFSPHLTLARVPPEAVASQASPIAAALTAVTVPAASMLVTELSLMRSILRPDGAVYQRVAAFPLR